MGKTCCQRCQGYGPEEFKRAIMAGEAIEIMYICPKCGNKRCPRVRWHDFECFGSNEPCQAPVRKGNQWPMFEDLHSDERDDFKKWMVGQTVGQNKDGSTGFYPWDYERWRRGLPVID